MFVSFRVSLQNGAAPAASLGVVGRKDFVLVAVEEEFTRPSFPSVVNLSDGHHSDLLSLSVHPEQYKIDNSKFL